MSFRINRILSEGFVGPQLRNFFGSGISTELFYSFVIIACSLMIYFGTKEFYELSYYKGIKYFRKTFLFFSIAYFFRSFIKFMFMSFNLKGIIEIFPTFLRITGIFTQFLFIYFSSMAIFYLLYSVMWKEFSKKSINVYLFHFLAIIISFIGTIYRNPIIYLAINLFLLSIFLVLICFSNKKKKKSKNHLFFIYVLLSFFWILNIIDTLIPRFFQGIQLFIYLLSTFTFLLILYKVIKKTGVS